MNPYLYVLALLIALVVTTIATPLAIKLANRFNVIDYPDGRRINDRPVPRLGGVAIFAGLAASMASMAIIIAFTTPDTSGLGFAENINFWGVALALTVIFAVGLVDDLRTVRVRYKFLVQIGAAVIACMSGVLFDSFTNPFDGSLISLGFVAYPITVFYLVAFANIINLIDGLDGLAAGIVTISGIALFIISSDNGYSDVALITMCIVGACLAFLRFNFHPARIFMGDSGALTLGFLMGLISLFGAIRTTAIISLMVPIVIAGIPVIDTFSAIIRRLRSGTSVVDADTGHIHHRLMSIGYDQKTTVYILYVLSGLLSIFALLLVGRGDGVRALIVAILIVMIGALVVSLRLTEPILKHYYVKRKPKRRWRGRSVNIPTTGRFGNAEPIKSITDEDELNEGSSNADASPAPEAAEGAAPANASANTADTAQTPADAPAAPQQIEPEKK